MSDKYTVFSNALADMKQILDLNMQPFFLACGTLLGQSRDNNFIAWDDDIDLGVFYNTVSPALKEQILQSPHFRLFGELGNYDESYELRFQHKSGVKIDVFVHYPIEKEEAYYYTASFYGACDHKKEGYCKWGVHVRGLQIVHFAGQDYWVPTNADEYLTESYGEDWKTPKKFGYYEGLDGGLYKNLIN